MKPWTRWDGSGQAGMPRCRIFTLNDFQTSDGAAIRVSEIKLGTLALSLTPIQLYSGQLQAQCQFRHLLIVLSWSQALELQLLQGPLWRNDSPWLSSPSWCYRRRHRPGHIYTRSFTLIMTEEGAELAVDKVRHWASEHLHRVIIWGTHLAGCVSSFRNGSLCSALTQLGFISKRT